ncbi:Exo70 exocyst complex subunit [Pelomyxa schiedti]|nr:Exo70 exocyst complex subunit [Pelomyxa schiedti]
MMDRGTSLWALSDSEDEYDSDEDVESSMLGRVGANTAQAAAAAYARAEKVLRLPGRKRRGSIDGNAFSSPTSSESINPDLLSALTTSSTSSSSSTSTSTSSSAGASGLAAPAAADPSNPLDASTTSIGTGAGKPRGGMVGAVFAKGVGAAGGLVTTAATSIKGVVNTTGAAAFDVLTSVVPGSRDHGKPQPDHVDTRVEQKTAEPEDELTLEEARQVIELQTTFKRTGRTTTAASQKTKADLLAMVENDNQLITSTRDALDSYQDKTVQMGKLFDTFINRLHKLEENTQEVHTDTQKLKRLHTNIEVAMESIEKILDVLSTPDKLKEKINEGPSTNHAQYYHDIDELDEAEKFLRAVNTFRSAETALETINTLKGTAATNLEKLYTSLIKRISAPIDPMKFLETWQVEGPPPQMIDESNTLTSKLVEWGKKTKFKEDYEIHRKLFLQQSLEKLNIEKIVTYDTEKLSRNYVAGSHPFIVFAKVITNMLQYERNISRELLPDLPEHESKGLLTQIITPSVKLFETTGLNILQGQNISNKPLAVFLFVDIFQNLRKLLPEFKKDLETSSPECFTIILTMATKYKETATMCFEAFRTDIGKDKGKQGMPADGTVHETTSNTMNYLKKFAEYTEVVNFLLPGETRHSIPYVSYILNVLDVLFESLQARAKKDKYALDQIFMLNNVHYILTTANSSPLCELLDSAQKEVVSRCEAMLRQHKEMYIRCWQRARDALSMDTASVDNNSLVKSKFKTFNSEVESIVNAQQKFVIPDKELRDELRGMVTDLIHQRYNMFFVSYSTKQFSKKHQYKYRKYQPEDLTAVLQRLFEGVSDTKPKTITSIVKSAALNASKY